MSDLISPELVAVLRRLKLSLILPTLPDRLALARQHKLPSHDLLLTVLADEVSRRDSNAVAVRAAKARLDPAMRLERWGDTARVTFDRALLQELATLRFLDQHARHLGTGCPQLGRYIASSGFAGYPSSSRDRLRSGLWPRRIARPVVGEHQIGTSGPPKTTTFADALIIEPGRPPRASRVATIDSGDGFAKRSVALVPSARDVQGWRSARPGTITTRARSPPSWRAGAILSFRAPRTDGGRDREARARARGRRASRAAGT